MVDNLEELAELLMRRDSISRNEADEIILYTKQEIVNAIDESEPFETLEDIISYNLGLEPDYLDLFLNELYF